MADRIDVVALKAISLGGVNYQPGDQVAMGAGRVRQYELLARMGKDPMIARAEAPEATPVAPPAATPPSREARVMNADPAPAATSGRYRTRRLKAEV